MSRKMIFLRIGASALFVLLSACASEKYSFLPTNASQRGKADYSIPEKTPTGSVRVMSGGIVKLESKKNGEKIPTLNIRMTVSNQSSNAPWILDPQAQYVSFPNASEKAPPFFAQSDSNLSPQMTINRGEMKTVDLFFKLPDDLKSAKKIPEFDFHWRVMAGNQLVDQTTSFDRVEILPYQPTPWPYYYPYGYPLGFGPYYPYGPDFWWTPSTIVVTPGIPSPPPSKPVIIGH